jgi:hypothetical protein
MRARREKSEDEARSARKRDATGEVKEDRDGGIENLSLAKPGEHSNSDHGDDSESDNNSSEGSETGEAPDSSENSDPYADSDESSSETTSSEGHSS